MSNLENYMKQQAIFCEQNDSISKNLYSEYGVKRGLRDEKGQGVLTGLTNISDIKAFEYRDPYHVEPIELTKKRTFGTASAWLGKISVLIKEEEDRVSNINCRR